MRPAATSLSRILQPSSLAITSYLGSRPRSSDWDWWRTSLMALLRRRWPPMRSRSARWAFPDSSITTDMTARSRGSAGRRSYGDNRRRDRDNGSSERDNNIGSGDRAIDLDGLGLGGRFERVGVGCR